MGFIKDKSGLIGIAAPFLGRYRDFPMCVDRIECSVGTSMNWYYGVATTDSYNMAARYLLQHPEHEWLWLLDDGFVFLPELWRNLATRNVDVVVPLTLFDEYPYGARIYEDAAGGYADVEAGWLKDQQGMVKLMDKTCEVTGMLVKRQVLEQLDDPWFINGRTRKEELGSGVWFCQQLHEKGIDLYLDLDNSMGTITQVGVSARRHKDGKYSSAVNVNLY
jgi:hypothetical protein